MAGIRLFWLTIGVVALAAASIGVLLPLIPTTPFVLLAAFAFMKSSQRLHDWLLRHPIFGKLIADWRRYGAISRKAKLLSVISLLAVIIISLLLEVSTTMITIQAVVVVICAVFILSRPAPPDKT